MAQLADHVLRARDVAVVHLRTSRIATAKDPAFLSGHGPAFGTARGGAALVGELVFDPDLVQPVAKGPRGVDHRPAMRAAILDRTGIFVPHTGGVTDDHL